MVAFRHLFLTGILCLAHAGMVLAQAERAPRAVSVSQGPPDIVLRPTIPAYYPGCDDVPEGTEDKAACSTGKLMGFISRRLKYPDAAKEQDIQGVVVLSFVVTDSGNIERIQILRSIGGGCAEEAVRVISEMPRWQPAIYKGAYVHTQFTLPITFGLKVNLYEYVLHTGTLDDVEVTRTQLVDFVSQEDLSVTNPAGAELKITEVVYTIERGGQKEQLVTRGLERPAAKTFTKFVGRRPARLTIEANVVDGLDIRTVTKNFVVTR